MGSIIDNIPTGKQNAIKGLELAACAQLPDGRAVRYAVAKARAEGEIICSGRSGYYIPETEEEIAEYIRMMEHHAKSTLIATRSARAKLKEITGQIRLDSFGDEAG